MGRERSGRLAERESWAASMEVGKARSGSPGQPQWRQHLTEFSFFCLGFIWVAWLCASVVTLPWGRGTRKGESDMSVMCMWEAVFCYASLLHLISALLPVQEMWLSGFILFFPPVGLLLGCLGSQAFWLEFEALTQVVVGPRVGTCVRVATWK